MNNLSVKGSRHWVYWLGLLITCIVAYWPVSLHLFSLKNDALNYFLPVRYQISEAISHGYWPFWSPYFNLGYPLHGDMQSGVWNPIVQLFSLFGPYTLRTLELETLLYVFLSGVSMFELISYFKINKKISFLVAVSYMLCGFNSDSAQFLNWISAASFLPAVFLFYYRTLEEQSRRVSVLFGFFMYLFFSTAYPADFILLLYLLIAVFFWYFFRKRFYQSSKKLLLSVRLHLPAIVCFTLLSLPAILSYVQALALTERGNGASYEAAMSNPYHPLLLFSYVTPLAVWKAPHVWITDPLERNSYIGIITLTVLIWGLITPRKTGLVWFSVIALLVSLIFSLGELGLIRPLSYYVLPLMDTFRHPANAKLFTIFFACLIAAFTLDKHSSDEHLKQRKVAWFIVCFLIGVMIVWAAFGKSQLFASIITASFNRNTNTGQQLKSALDTLTFSDLLYINILIQLPFLFITYLYFVRRINLKVLLAAGIINSTIHTMLFMPFTVVKKDRATSIQHLLDSVQTKGYPHPDYRQTLKANSVNAEALMMEIGTLNMYKKKIGRAEYRITPSNLNSQNEFWHSQQVRDVVMTYPLLYRADTAINYNKSSSRNIPVNKKAVWLTDSSSINFTNTAKEAPYQFKSKTFGPNQWEIEIESTQPGFYCLAQNLYPNWQLYIDGNKEPLEKCNLTFMGFRLDKGKHVIKFRYEAQSIKISFYISLLLTLVISLYTLKHFFIKQKNVR